MRISRTGCEKTPMAYARCSCTRTTKAIEAQISHEVWDRQRRWELEKEAVFESIRELGIHESGAHEVDVNLRGDAPAGIE